MNLGPALTPNHARLREIGLALPDALETTQLYDHLVFKVGQKTFLWLDDSGESVTLKADPGAREILLQDPLFEVAAYIGRYGWFGFAMGPNPDWSGSKTSSSTATASARSSSNCVCSTR